MCKIPQKLTTTVCFIQRESSGDRPIYNIGDRPIQVIDLYIIVQNTSKTYHYSLFHPEGIQVIDSLWMKQTVVVSF